MISTDLKGTNNAGEPLPIRQPAIRHTNSGSVTLPSDFGPASLLTLLRGVRPLQVHRESWWVRHPGLRFAPARAITLWAFSPGGAGAGRLMLRAIKGQVRERLKA